MKKNKYIASIMMLVFFLTACTSLKETLSGNKKKSTDEFFVKKKSPLILPPDFNDLPKPKKETIEEISKNDSIDFSSVLSESKNKDQIEQKKNSSLEKSISKILNSN